MGQIGHQLGELLLGALPTAVIVTLFIIFMRWAFWTPFQRVLEQRESATIGARKDADQMLTRAEEKVREYEDALHEVRTEIYREQEEARKKMLDERTQAIGEARDKAGQMIQKAKTEIAAEVETARKDLDSQAKKLAKEIADSLLSGQGSRGNA
jgi:F-type H+-transporting ATPase subunit b